MKLHNIDRATVLLAQRQSYQRIWKALSERKFEIDITCNDIKTRFDIQEKEDLRATLMEFYKKKLDLIVKELEVL